MLLSAEKMTKIARKATLRMIVIVVVDISCKLKPSLIDQRSSQKQSGSWKLLAVNVFLLRMLPQERRSDHLEFTSYYIMWCAYKLRSAYFSPINSCERHRMKDCPRTYQIWKLVNSWKLYMFPGSFLLKRNSVVSGAPQLKQCHGNRQTT